MFLIVPTVLKDTEVVYSVLDDEMYPIVDLDDGEVEWYRGSQLPNLCARIRIENYRLNDNTYTFKSRYNIFFNYHYLNNKLRVVRRTDYKHLRVCTEVDSLFTIEIRSTQFADSVLFIDINRENDIKVLTMVALADAAFDAYYLIKLKDVYILRLVVTGKFGELAAIFVALSFELSVIGYHFVSLNEHVTYQVLQSMPIVSEDWAKFCMLFLR